jgi:hypothetical protein
MTSPSKGVRGGESATVADLKIGGVAEESERKLISALVQSAAS